MKITVNADCWHHGVTFNVSEDDFNRIVLALISAEQDNLVKTTKEILNDASDIRATARYCLDFAEKHRSRK